LSTREDARDLFTDGGMHTAKKIRAKICASILSCEQSCTAVAALSPSFSGSREPFSTAVNYARMLELQWGPGAGFCRVLSGTP